MGALARTPLYEEHVAAGAKIVPFAGFEMPVVYSSIIEEHRAVRASAGLFDVSHMGEVRIAGPDAVAFTQSVFTNHVAKTAPGRARYGLLCRPDGGIVDDVMLFRIDADEILLCLNAANVAKDLAWIRGVHADQRPKCEIVDESDDTALLAIQGPRAIEIAGRALGADAPAPRRFRFAGTTFAGHALLVSRTGYTGEDGYEIFAPARSARDLWHALVEAGQGELRLAGLGARDTLRTEMAYPLYGHEIDDATNPIEAGLERGVAFDQPFIGHEAILACREAGPTRKLVGLLVEGRRIAREGTPIFEPGGAEAIGSVRSGTHAPSVERSIAIGYVPASRAGVGEVFEVEIRGRRARCEVTTTPFHAPSTRGSSDA